MDYYKKTNVNGRSKFYLSMLLTNTSYMASARL